MGNFWWEPLMALIELILKRWGRRGQRNQQISEISGELFNAEIEVLIVHSGLPSSAYLSLG